MGTVCFLPEEKRPEFEVNIRKVQTFFFKEEYMFTRKEFWETFRLQDPEVNIVGH